MSALEDLQHLAQQHLLSGGPLPAALASALAVLGSGGRAVCSWRVVLRPRQVHSSGGARSCCGAGASSAARPRTAACSAALAIECAR